MDESLIVEVAHAIRLYLHDHPAAGDTDVGVHAWWIRWPGLPPPLTVTQAALKRLQAEGAVQCRYGIWQRA
ncbi:hypothetical protein ACFJGW_17975 [Burkholderiaceae bacterium UC74_6]